MKQITKFNALLLSISVIMTVLPCNKNQDATSTTKTKTEQPTISLWKYTACIVSPSHYYGDGNSVTDILPS